MKNLDHPDRELLIRLALGEMTELDAKPILTHLASCDSCRSEFLGCCDDLEKLRGDDPVLAEDLNLGAERRLALMAKFRGSQAPVANPNLIRFPSVPSSIISWFVATAAVAFIGVMLLPSLGSSRKDDDISAIACVAPASTDSDGRINRDGRPVVAATDASKSMAYAPVPPPPPPRISIEDNRPLCGTAVDDNTLSTNDAAMVDLVSDVKAVVSPTTSSKMYAGRRATGRTGVLEAWKTGQEEEKKSQAAKEGKDWDANHEIDKDGAGLKGRNGKNILTGEAEGFVIPKTINSLSTGKDRLEPLVDLAKKMDSDGDGKLSKNEESAPKATGEKRKSAEVAGGGEGGRDKQLDQAKNLYADRQFDKAKEAAEQVLVEDPFNKEAAEVLTRTNGRLSETGRLRAPPDLLLLKQNAAADQVLAESAKRSQGLEEAQAAAQEEAQSKAQAEAEAAKPSENAEAAKAAVNAKVDAERSEEVRQEPTPAEELARRDKEREAAKQRALCFKDASKEPLSTFAMDVDTASYQRVKEMIQKGQSVSPEAVRTEEFVNAFNYNYATPEASSFAIHAEHAPSNLGQGRKLLRVAVQAARPGADSRRPSRLTILVDTSGSMARENRLPLLRKVLPEMLKQMRPSDSLTLIACDSSPRLLADRIPAGDTERLERAFAELKPSGATNLEAGLAAAYKNATDHFDPAGMNRLVLISDGVANLGDTKAESILGRAVEARRLGVSATVVGMGRGEYNDRFLETLADKGNGFYAYVDNAESAQRFFVDNFSANFAAIAKDAKIQMEFDPAAVRSWRLLGYENRLLAAAEFRDDKVGGGSVGPGQSVTAVYELDCVPGLAPEARLGVMHIRYQDPSGRLARESERPIYGRDGATSFDSASFSLRLAAVAAQFAEQLKGYNRDHELTLKALHQLALEQPGNPALGELIQLMEKVGGEDIKL